MASTSPSTQPAAGETNSLIIGNARFQFLTDRMVRLEWQEHGQHEDRATLAVVNRRMPKVPFTTWQRGNETAIDTRSMTVRYTGNGDRFTADNLSITFKLDGQPVTWKPGDVDAANLGGTTRTLDGVNGNLRGMEVPNPIFKEGAAGDQGRRHLWLTGELDLGRGLLSRSGWALVDDSRNIVLDGPAKQPWVTPRPAGERQDWYFLGYGHDYKEALRDAAEVFGRQPMPPRYAFGYWWSRYWAYTDREIEGLVDAFDSMNVPIDVMVLDMDWHLEGWTGYTWDRRYFPDPAEFLSHLKHRGMKVTLNLHPADGVGSHEEAFEPMARAMGLDPAKTDRVKFDITDPKYMENYFEHLHHPDEGRGVDFWWIDWQQGETTAMAGLDTLPWINHLHWHDMARNPQRRGKRPLIFSRFGGIGAGRYCIGFSGDTISNWESLQYQPYFTATAANVLYGYWSHDIGGHMPGPIEPELYTRWMQFGLYSPILRTHTTKNSESERRIWQYPDPFNRIMMDVIRTRYELAPYIYTESRRTYETGVSLCRPMYYDHPGVDAAYTARNQYMFGDAMLVAPICTRTSPDDEMAEASVWLPEGPWYDTARGKLETGGRTIRRRYFASEVPVFVRPGSIIPGQTNVRRLNDASIHHLTLTVYPGNDGDYTLYEDDGSTTAYEKNKCARIRITQSRRGTARQIVIAPPVGTYKGFAPTKDIEFRLPCTVPPRRITAGGKSLDWHHRPGAHGWTYEGDTATTVIRLPAVNLTRGLTLLVEPGNDGAADGLKGLMTRLLRVGYYNTLSTDSHILHPAERLGIELAQTGNRIQREPERFAAELKNLWSKIGTLPEIFDALRGKGNIGQQGEYRVRNCSRAISILKVIDDEFKH